MTPLVLILSIVKDLTEIALITVRNIPAEQHARFWEDWRKTLDFWQGLAEKARNGEHVEITGK